MRTVRHAVVPFALVLLAGPASGQRDSLPGTPGNRASAVDAATDKLAEMAKLLSGSREKPERAVKAWDGLTAELWDAWREGKPPAGTGGAAEERGAKRPHEAFLGEWTTGGRELLVFRQGLVQKTDGLQAAIDAFPARRSEWLARMDDASKRMGLGEKALAELSPKVAAVQEAVDRVVVAKNVAVNVAADTQAIRDQVQREYGKKETMPTGVTNVLGRFSKAPELHPGVPESWQRSMLDAAVLSPQGLRAERRDADEVRRDVRRPRPAAALRAGRPLQGPGVQRPPGSPFEARGGPPNAPEEAWRAKGDAGGSREGEAAQRDGVQGVLRVDEERQGKHEACGPAFQRAGLRRRRLPGTSTRGRPGELLGRRRPGSPTQVGSARYETERTAGGAPAEARAGDRVGKQELHPGEEEGAPRRDRGAQRVGGRGDGPMAAGRSGVRRNRPGVPEGVRSRKEPLRRQRPLSASTVEPRTTPSSARSRRRKRRCGS